MPDAVNDTQVRALHQRLAAVDTAVRTFRDTLSDAQLAWQPPDGGWSIAQVLEHLTLSHDSYLAALRTRVRHPDAPRAGTEPWKPSFFGGLLARSLESPRRMPTAKIWRVQSTARAAAANAFLERQRELAALVSEAAGLDWRRIRFSSPAMRIIRMNLGDVFAVLTVHAERHTRQMERVLAHPAFPGREAIRPPGGAPAAPPPRADVTTGTS